ncbi:MAG: hypothetical protein GDA36_08745 [Rhodobacteraceae bacterium]|nr:hypothetical protein [Paracoccaceae bacterium]
MILGTKPVQSTAHPGSHSSADTQARWIKKGSKSTPGYKGFVRPDEARTRKVSSTRPTRAPVNRAGDPRVWYHGRRGEYTCECRPDKAFASKANRDARAVATVTGSCERPPVIDPCVSRKNAAAG